jgi:hypothetical protein
VINTPTRPPNVPAMVHCVYLSNGCLNTPDPGGVKVTPRKEYMVTPVMNAAIAQARNTRGSDMTMLRLCAGTENGRQRCVDMWG